MWTILCSLALAVSPDELAAELPGARVQLDACATEGCDREEAARAAWLLALGTYVETGVADGELSATVRVLDPALWSQLPPVLLDAATDPAGWAQRVGGAPPPSGARSSSERVAAVRSIQLHARPRIFVVSEPGSGRDYDDPKLQRELKVRTAQPAAVFYPAGDLCQQGPIRDLAPPADGPMAEIGFIRRDRFTPTELAATYTVWVDGVEVVLANPEGVLALPAGSHQVRMMRDDGVGPVLDVELAAGERILDLPDVADACIADALAAGPEALVPHFRRLSERVPGPVFYVARVGAKPRDARLWRWDGEGLTEIPRR